MNLELIGILRALQGEIGNMVALLVIIGVAYFLIRYLVSTVDRDEYCAEKQGVRVAVTWIFGIIAAVAIIGFVATAVVRTAENRAPRAVVDQSSVYDQMNSHLGN
jgi:type II secretory pathway pseudopilin PulG